MDPWDDLLKTALLGTGRQPPLASPAGGDAVSATLAQVPPEPADASVLSRVAIVSTARRAGRRPRPLGGNPPAPADVEDLPQPGPRASLHVQRILEGEGRDLLPEWLAAAAAAGRRAPDLALPALLDAGRQNTDLRDPIIAVLGKRGRWLAAQNPEWAYASGAAAGAGAAPAEDVTGAWETAAHAARLGMLRGLRRSDPARARTLLEATWPQETAAHRADLIATFKAGLSPEDEPMLEKALDDRSLEVRRNAADLLARLPSSALVARMVERARPLLEWKPGKKPKLEVTLPKPPDKAAERDGIEAKPRNARFGQKQGWLWQVLSAVPPADWSRQWGAKPADVVAALRKHEFETVLVGAWAHAAARYGDAEWAEALVAAEASGVQAWGGEQVLRDLVEVLPAARRDALLVSRLESAPESETLDLITVDMLRGAGSAWGKQLTRAVASRVRAVLSGRRNALGYVAAQLLQEMALRAPPQLLGELSEGWGEGRGGGGDWQTYVDRFLATIRQRQHMLEEILK